MRRCACFDARCDTRAEFGTPIQSPSLWGVGRAFNNIVATSIFTAFVTRKTVLYAAFCVDARFFSVTTSAWWDTARRRDRLIPAHWDANRPVPAASSLAALSNILARTGDEIPAHWDANRPVPYGCDLPAIFTARPAFGTRLNSTMDVFQIQTFENMCHRWNIAASQSASFASCWNNTIFQHDVHRCAGLCAIRAAAENGLISLGGPPQTMSAALITVRKIRHDRLRDAFSLYDIHREGWRAFPAFSSIWTMNRIIGANKGYHALRARHANVRYWQENDVLNNRAFRRYAADICGAICDHYRGVFATGPAGHFDLRGRSAAATMTAAWGWLEMFRAGMASRFHALTLPGAWVMVRNTDTGVERKIGFVTEDALAAGNAEIADIALPDGEYEIEARPASYFWPEARTPTFGIYRLQSAQEPEKGLPEIVNLRAAMGRGYMQVLSWSVIAPSDVKFSFGVWFGDGMDVDISGAPHASVSRTKGLDYYEYYYKQTDPLYVAVAAITSDGIRGKPAILHVPWDAAKPNSPCHQWAESSPAYNFE